MIILFEPSSAITSFHDPARSHTVASSSDETTVTPSFRRLKQRVPFDAGTPRNKLVLQKMTGV